MIYDLKLKGFPELHRVDDPAGVIETKYARYHQTKVDEVIETVGWTGPISDIRSYKRVGPSGQAQQPDTSHIEYMKDRAEKLARPIAERAKDMGFFRMIYWSYTGKKSEDVMTLSGAPLESLVEKIQLKFFTEHPRRTVCDPILYKPVIKSVSANTFGLSTIEQVVRQDMFAARNL